MLTPAEGAGDQNGNGLNLSWLEAVQERATVQTSDLRAHRLAEIEATRAARVEQARAEAGLEPEAEAGAGAQAPEANEAEGPPNEAPPKEPAPGTTAREGAPDEPPPEWVVGILEPNTTPPTSAEHTYEPEEMAHIMPWMTEPTESGAPGMPPWLGDVTVQETLQARGEDTNQQTTDELLLDLEGLEPFAPPEGDELAPQDQTVEVTAQSQSTEQVPEWLKTLTHKQEEEKAETKPRFEHFTPLTSVLLNSTDTLSQSIAGGVPVRPPRPGSVETLVALVQAPAEEGPKPTVQTPKSRWQQAGARSAESRGSGLLGWLLPDGVIYLAVVAALLAVMTLQLPFGTLSAPAAPDALEFYRAVEAAPTDKPVLVVYDWDAGVSAEMSALAGAVTHHLMSRRLHFVTISTIPQGPGFAQQVTAAAANDPTANYGYEYGRDYLVLGYVPGGEAALSSLVNDFSALMPLDYVNSQKLGSFDLVRGDRLRSLGDFGMVIDLASGEAALRTWIEQVATRTGVPLVAAVPQGLEPLARPYKGVAGTGLKAVLSGQAGAQQYLQQLIDTRRVEATPYNANTLTGRLNAQLVAQLLVTLAILGAFVSMGLRRILGGSSKS